MNPRFRNRTIRGFTLIEIVVVLVLVAMLASAVAMSAGGMLNNATQEEAVAQIDSLDSEARRTAKRLGRTVELHIDSETKQFTLRDPQKPSSPPLGSYRLPHAFEITQSWRLIRGEPQNDTALVIRYEQDRTAMTWGLTISDRNAKEDVGSVMILGMTGQMTQWDNHEEASDILAKALGRHTD